MLWQHRPRQHRELPAELGGQPRQPLPARQPTHRPKPASHLPRVRGQPRPAELGDRAVAGGQLGSVSVRTCTRERCGLCRLYRRRGVGGGQLLEPAV